MGDVRAWPNPTGRPLPLPRRIMRPCDYGLLAVMRELETQLGTVEAYNRLVEAAHTMRVAIDGGRVVAQNPMYAVSIRGETQHVTASPTPPDPDHAQETR